MKKLGVFLMALWVSVGVTAKQTDIDNLFKEYVIQDNNINKCLFPDIYRSTDRGETVLDKWWSDTENNGRMKRAYYLKLKMRLAQRVLPSEVAESFLFSHSPKYQDEYKQALTRYSKKTSIKSKKECKKVVEFATNLIEEYDEINERWRIEFSNP